MKVFIINPPKNYELKENEEEINYVYSDLNINEDDIFVSFDESSEQYKNSRMVTPLGTRLRYYNIPRNNLVIVAKNKKFNLEDDKNFIDDYQIFSGEKLDSDNTEIQKIVKKQIKDLSNIMYQMLKAGYLVGEDRKKIDDWIITFEEPILKLLINYHGFISSNPSVLIEEEFLINPEFRKQILITIMKIISNYLVNNDLMTIKINDWLDEKEWYRLKNNISFIDN